MPSFFKRSYKKKSYKKPNKGFQNISRLMSMLPKREVKKFTVGSTDTEIGDVIPTSTAGAQTVLLSSIAQGDDVQNRQGNSVEPKYLSIRYNINNLDDSSPPAVNTSTTVQARVIIVQDTQQNASTPLITQVLTAANLQSHLNVDFVGRFRVLHDKVHNLVSPNTAAGVVSAYTVEYVEKYIKLNSKNKIMYTGANGTDVSNGNIYMFYFRNSDLDTTAGSEYGRIAYNVRLGFYDD